MDRRGVGDQIDRVGQGKGREKQPGLPLPHTAKPVILGRCPEK
ncbi:MAG: hypothetical protein Q7V48_09970 [Deltaproteobacteria bacterium]|nr:hypothetical protein [Deltaproteobacteria bacterium]